MTPIPIDTGTLPAVDAQVNSPRLRGGFVNTQKHVQLLPNLFRLFELNNCRAIFKSTFKNRQIVVTQREVFYIQNQEVIKVGDIISTTNAVRVDENTQNQVTIVNGAGAWVFEQRTGGFSKLNATSNGFTLTEPVDVTVLDTITIVVGKVNDTNTWIVSEANNALIYAANLVRLTDNSMGDLSGCTDLNNNLFIFGTEGVQRWLPNIERVPTDFPFSQDPSYRDDYGCISTGSLTTDNNELFYLSRGGQVRMMRSEGRHTITNDGIENIINSYADTTNSFGSYFYHKGFYLYHLSFPAAKNAFVFCPRSNKWSESDDMWIDFSENVILKDGIYELTQDYSNAYRTLILETPYFKPKPTDMYMRSVLGSVLLEMTQGKGTVDTPQSVFLQLSKDNIFYGNRVKDLFSKIGDRLFQFRWFMNYVNNGFSLRFTIELQQDVTFTSIQAEIK